MSHPACWIHLYIALVHLFLIRYLYESRDVIARQLAQKLSFQENDTTLPLDRFGDVDEAKIAKDPLALSYSTYATHIYRNAKKHREDSDYADPLPMKEIFYVLPEDMTGSNKVFNEGMYCVVEYYFSVD